MSSRLRKIQKRTAPVIDFRAMRADVDAMIWDGLRPVLEARRAARARRLAWALIACAGVLWTLGAVRGCL